MLFHCESPLGCFFFNSKGLSFSKVSSIFIRNSVTNKQKDQIYQGHRQVQQSGVDNTEWGVCMGVPYPVGVGSGEGAMRCPLPIKRVGLSFWNGVFWRILGELEWRLPWCNNVQFWCVHTVTNWLHYRNCLICTAIWNFSVKCRLPQQINRRPLWNE